MSVINDLSTDQRVHKHCTLLHQKGFDVLLIGRQMSSSAALQPRDYQMHRMQLPFETGPLFYASYNIGLFFNLLVRKVDLFFSNDLDTLLPNFLVSKLRSKPLIYDSHEYFTEVPELVNRPKVQGFWKWLESKLIPKLPHALTVNTSIAELYKKDFGVDMKVVRNIPPIQEFDLTTKAELGLPIDKKLIILQGSGINIQRGAEEAVEAMQYVDGAVLLILGSGDVIDRLHQMVDELNLKDRVIFKPKMPYAQMMSYTRLADLGLTLDKDTNVNYRFSLPNKLFDYIRAETPVLGSDLVEVRNIIEEYQVGDVCKSHDPKELGKKMSEMLTSVNTELWKQNCKNAKQVLNWERESEVLKEMIDQIDG